MQTIRQILYQSKGAHPKTFATLEQGDEVYIGYGLNFKIGDRVEIFYHEIWDQNKMRKTPNSIDKHNQDRVD